MQAKELMVKELESIALEGGATVIKQISPQDIIVAQWVRNKCQFGCPHFGKRFTCPPYAPTPQETVATLKSYQKALLVEFGNLHPVRGRLEPVGRMTHNTLYNMERCAFLNGHERVFFYGGGPCVLCRSCPAEKLENPNLFCKKECKRPEEARPSMEAAGIDVYSTVRQAGFKPHVVRERTETFTDFGLVLLE